ncbi:MAG: aspartate aminotransferase family protein, partial [Deltaproteobacteria bacterium]
PEICAVILEPVQGEGGVRTPDEDYLRQVRKLCDETGILLIFDEIQTGIGRTGKLFAYEHYGIKPDIMTLAKALANGLPMGAMLSVEHVAAAFGPGSHASTFGGTPLVSAAALATLRVLREENIIEHCARVGEYFREKLFRLKEHHPVVKDVRGRGLLLGMELRTAGKPVVDACQEKGFLVNCIQDKILRFAPPLIITVEEIDALIKCLDEVL